MKKCPNNLPKTFPKRRPSPSKIDAENVSFFNIGFFGFRPRFWKVLGLQLGAKLALKASNAVENRPLGPVLAYPGPVLACLGLSWLCLGSVLACLGPVLDCLGPVLGLPKLVLARLGPALACLGFVLGLSWLVLLSWPCLGLSWACLGPVVAPLGHGLACLGSVLGHMGGLGLPWWDALCCSFLSACCWHF